MQRETRRQTRRHRQGQIFSRAREGETDEKGRDERQRPGETERMVRGRNRRERWGHPAETEMKRKQRDLGRDGANTEIRGTMAGWREGEQDRDSRRDRGRQSQ